LVGLGPLANVTVSPPISHPDALQNTGSMNLRMMIDTGAQRTVVDRGIAESLGLVPIRFEPMVGVSHVPEDCPVYLMSLTIGVADDLGGKTLVSFTSEMIGMATPPTPRQFNGLLGRDFLRHARLSYDGKAGHCDLIVDVPGKSGHAGKDRRKEKRKAERAARKKNRR
jgi:hypothetical protein